jgi:hypothetical protein
MTAPGQRHLDDIELLSMRLKGHVGISQTIPTGPYRSLKVEVMEEYWQDETTFEDKLNDLIERLRLELIRRGVVKE